MTGTFTDIALDPDSMQGNSDLGDIFTRCGPIHIEIGSGKGTFLLNFARSNPHLNVLGIEWANKYYRYSVDRMLRWGIDNVRIVRTEAASFIRECVGGSTISVFHVYFPDPWPKKKHHKRRFINQENIEIMHRCLVNRGELRLATDHVGYFEWMSDLFRLGPGNRALFEKIDFQSEVPVGEGERVGSNFERKYLEEGRLIHTLALTKTPV